MSEIRTEAGKRLLDDYFELQRDSGPQVYAAIAAIEAEAAAAAPLDVERLARAFEHVSGSVFARHKFHEWAADIAAAYAATWEMS